MKNLKYFLSLFLLATLLGCSDDDNDTGFIDDIAAPTNLSAIFTITQDNSGKVTIRPNGEGVTSYSIVFGDETQEPGTLAPGQEIDHIYAEGNYTVKIIGIGINGKETEYTQPLTVSYAAPTNLAVNITPETGNPYKINVTASALLETFFTITFGETVGETPIEFNEGQTVSHTYATIGTYEVKVIAYSGGAATSEFVQNVTIFDPLLLPIDFESPTLNYAFGDFGGSFGSVADNPSVSGLNTSAKVGKIVKTAGAEVWAGITLALDAPIDFSTLQKISMKAYAPVAGAIVKLKLENINDANINVEVDATTTVVNDWETLLFDFTGVNNANNYQRVVVFYDFGNNGNGAEFHFDDVKLTTGDAQVELPLTFQNAALAYTFTSFGNSSATVTDNPDQSGINTSTKVGQHTKNSGSEVWAGSFIELATPIDFSSLHKIKMKVWSPQAGAIVKMKLENLANSAINIEVDATTTVAGGWEELTYDFSAAANANAYQRVVVFFNFNVIGDGSNYYFDDIKLSN